MLESFKRQTSLVDYFASLECISILRALCMQDESSDGFNQSPAAKVGGQHEQNISLFTSLHVLPCLGFLGRIAWLNLSHNLYNAISIACYVNFLRDSIGIHWHSLESAPPSPFLKTQECSIFQARRAGRQETMAAEDATGKISRRPPQRLRPSTANTLETQALLTLLQPTDLEPLSPAAKMLT